MDVEGADVESFELGEGAILESSTVARENVLGTSRSVAMCIRLYSIV